MAHYVTTLIIPRSIEESFEFISDFRNAPRWDPQSLEAYKVTDGPIGRGTSFLLIGSFLKQKLILPYEIVVYEPPSELVLVGESDMLSYRDRLEFSADGDAQTRLTYNAQLDFKGIFRLGDPVLQRLFKYIGDKATEHIPQAVADGTPSTAARDAR